MKDYYVSIQYGHFVQIWQVKAESKDDARRRAESHGTLMYQTVYKEIYPLKNYVTCKGEGESQQISKEQYDEWLLEAKELGMTVDGYYGLPFNDVN